MPSYISLWSRAQPAETFKDDSQMVVVLDGKSFIDVLEWQMNWCEALSAKFISRTERGCYRNLHFPRGSWRDGRRALWFLLTSNKPRAFSFTARPSLHFPNLQAFLNICRLIKALTYVALQTSLGNGTRSPISYLHRIMNVGAKILRIICRLCSLSEWPNHFSSMVLWGLWTENADIKHSP